MSKLNYTPGPWFWQTSCSFRRLGNDRGDGNVLYATTQSSDGHPDVELPNGGWDGPDARLIAAAPDMYEALRAIAAFPEGPEVTASFDEPHAAKIARDVLAKIKGNES